MYIASILLVAGFCFGLAYHAGCIVWRARDERQYGLLMILALLEAWYCIFVVPYFLEDDPVQARPWILLVSTVTPFMTYYFGQLTIYMTDPRSRWPHRLQIFNLFLTTSFSLSILSDLIFNTKIATTGIIHTDTATLRKHLIEFTTWGQIWLGFVSLVFYFFAFLLIRTHIKSKRDLLPIVIGIMLYFAAITSDWNILFGVYDFYFVQHFGFFCIVLGFSLVFANRYNDSKRRLEAALKEIKLHQDVAVSTEKLRVLGLLSAEIAHEIRTPLGIVIGTTELLQRKLRLRPDVGSEPLAMTEHVAKHAQRIQKIIDSLRSFARSGPASTLALCSVQEIIDGVVEVCAPRLRRERIDLEVTGLRSDLTIECRATQIFQVLLNLIVNAADAVQGHPDAWIRVSIKEVASALEFSVEDNGSGIPPEIRSQIWQAFFTTKPETGGTGLGLSLSSKIVADHKGRIWLDEHAPLTRFVFSLPRPPSSSEPPQTHLR